MYDLGKQKSINWYVVMFLIAWFIAVIAVFGVELANPTIDQNWGTIRLTGYCKAAITLVKYMPQVYLNWKRQSTVGWSLENVMLDFLGGAFSFAQLTIDTVGKGKPLFGVGSGTGFNIVKFLLSIIAMIFDLIFMFQHYVLYRDKWATPKKLEKQLRERQKTIDKVQDSIHEMGATNDLNPSLR